MSPVLGKMTYRDNCDHHLFVCPSVLSSAYHESYFTIYCKCGNFCVGVIFVFFAILSSLRKFPPGENKTHMTLHVLGKYDKNRENYLHVKGLGNIFTKFSPSENNNVYSRLLQLTYTLIVAPVKSCALWRQQNKYQTGISVSVRLSLSHALLLLVPHAFLLNTGFKVAIYCVTFMFLTYCRILYRVLIISYLSTFQEWKTCGIAYM